ncbi:pupal cuticle protein Edg-91 [Folsomia candida]|uniref:Uncharacterized protein n=1 Tax=Folsomia candida TaxID=158441 RepID=A0A226DE52_FOLCA|nr:pupal cuticle protein Edg-91 [Folsomia candida]OXA43449.1 hypothetical protein Fcan01_21829 [Folsomia candida]
MIQTSSLICILVIVQICVHTSAAKLDNTIHAKSLSTKDEKQQARFLGLGFGSDISLGVGISKYGDLGVGNPYHHHHEHGHYYPGHGFGHSGAGYYGGHYDYPNQFFSGYFPPHHHHHFGGRGYHHYQQQHYHHGNAGISPFFAGGLGSLASFGLGLGGGGYSFHK